MHMRNPGAYQGIFIKGMVWQMIAMHQQLKGAS